MRRTSGAVVLVLALATAGCGGLFGAPDAGADGSPTTVPPTTVAESAVVEYGSLNATVRSAFRDALDGAEPVFAPASPHLNHSPRYDLAHGEPFAAHDYVRYRGSLYRVRLPTVSGWAAYTIEASPGDPSDDAVVIDHETLPADLRAPVRQAIVDGSYTSLPGQWGSLPEPLTGHDYVRYENETYRLSVGVTDATIPGLRVERVPPANTSR